MQRTCANSWCSQSFEVTSDDLAFYEKVSPVFNGEKELIPPPTRCPECRMQRRLVWRNERSLYKRTCDHTKAEMIAMYPSDSPYTVYSRDAWFHDDWDPLAYGQGVDLHQPFFVQFEELFRRVPKMAMIQQANMVNAEYCNRASNDKNCYMIFTANFSEDCYYCVHITNCRNCVDCLNVHKSERCYECVDSYECYDCRWIESSMGCISCSFVKGCIACKDCMFCTNLSHKQFCIDNKQCSEEEYRALRKATSFQQRAVIEHLKSRFAALKNISVVRSYMGMHNENVSGNYIDHCKNVTDSFECRESEDCRYVQSLVQAKDCMDFTSWSRGCELIYETANCGYGCHNILFSNECWDQNGDLLYCNQCLHSSHCFGCCGLRYKQYCILNRQYSKDEYEELVPQIIERMRASGDWGEFLPGAFSPFAYNETNAQDYVPLTREQALSQHWRWKDDESDKTHSSGSGPPSDLSLVNEDLCIGTFTCARTGRVFKIIPQERKFYLELDVCVPDRCFEQRHRERLLLQTPRKLWSRTCAVCQKSISTSYSPERPEKVVCEECYLKEVY